MRLTALIPVACSITALILTFLCLFAGHKKGFMEDYHLLTLNTSLLGQTLLSEDRSSSNPLTNFFNNIQNELSESINDRIAETTARLGIQDWYSAHLMNHCAGQYTPIEVANATIPPSDISKNVTKCGKQRAMYTFNPTALLEDALKSTTGSTISLQDLNWPESIDTGIDTLNGLLKAVFILYCIAAGLFVLCLFAAVSAIFSTGKWTARVNVLLAVVGFLVVGIASALVTAVVVKGAQVVNDAGNRVGVRADWGGKFLALTWAAAGVVLVAAGWWVVEGCRGRRRTRREQVMSAKHG